ncbi:MAG: ABC transporter ATP-binding protein [Deltaproteobacteria bacterium]|jgi:iron complex transport system ATP-binding protein|nr:ABC transporter ATP-binding protein [Deltaproteobacteria bacterium]
MLQLTNYSYSLNGHSILEGLAFHLAKGAYLSVIGPNGAGKSTLLKCLLRLHEHGESQGGISVKGRPLTEYTQKQLARIIAYVPQAGGWIPPFTVEEFLRLSRYPYASATNGPGAADREAVRQALCLTDMEPLASRRLQTLSGGERQKAFLAAALAQQTEIMLLDEPASFLDPKHAADLNRLIKRLHQDQGLTMITVTHDLNHPLSIGGQALVLQRGRQLFLGPAQELSRQGILEKAYNHQFTYFRHPRTGGPAVLAD